MKLLLSLFIGLFFGLGLQLGGMTNPAKVLNFFDVFGTWDPSLIFVMGGAMAVTFVGYRIVWRNNAPWFGHNFHLPTTTQIDRELIAGAALFGIGWGISGFCPGGAIAALGSGRWEVILFIVAMIFGHFLKRARVKAATLQPNRLG